MYKRLFAGVFIALLLTMSMTAGAQWDGSWGSAGWSGSWSGGDDAGYANPRYVLLNASLDSTSYTAGSKTFLDTSPYARTLTSANAAAFSTLASGLRVMNFNGTSDLINTGAGWIGTGAVIIGFWIRPETVEGYDTYLFNDGRFAMKIDPFMNRFIAFSQWLAPYPALEVWNAWTANQWTRMLLFVSADGYGTLALNGQIAGTPNQYMNARTAGTQNIIVGTSFDGDMSYIDVWSGIPADKAAFARDDYNATKHLYQ